MSSSGGGGINRELGSASNDKGVAESSGSEEETGEEDEQREDARRESLPGAHSQTWSNDEWSYGPVESNQGNLSLQGSTSCPTAQPSMSESSRLSYTADRSYSGGFASYPFSPTSPGYPSDSSSFSNSYGASSTGSGPAGFHSPYPSNPYYYPLSQMGPMYAFAGATSGSHYPSILGLGFDASPTGSGPFPRDVFDQDDSSNDSASSMQISQAQQHSSARMPTQGSMPIGREAETSGNGWSTGSTTLKGPNRFHPYGMAPSHRPNNPPAERTPFRTLENQQQTFEQPATDQLPATAASSKMHTAGTSTSALSNANKASTPQLFISRLNQIDTFTCTSATGNQPSAPIGVDELLSFVRGNVSSPIIEYLCELLGSPDQYSHIVSWTRGGLRWEFKIHNTKTFADILNLRFGRPKSYLQIARALKSFEQKAFHGRVTLKKVKDKRNHFQFFPVGNSAAP